LETKNIIRFPWDHNRGTLVDTCEVVLDGVLFQASLQYYWDNEYNLMETSISTDALFVQTIPAKSQTEALGAANVILTYLGFTPREG